MKQHIYAAIHLQDDDPEVKAHETNVNSVALTVGETLTHVEIYGSEAAMRKVMAALQEHFGETPDEIKEHFLDNFDYPSHRRACR